MSVLEAFDHFQVDTIPAASIVVVQFDPTAPVVAEQKGLTFERRWPVVLDQ